MRRARSPGQGKSAQLSRVSTDLYGLNQGAERENGEKDQHLELLRVKMVAQSEFSVHNGLRRRMSYTIL
jgi:hypothetical protein